MYVRLARVDQMVYVGRAVEEALFAPVALAISVHPAGPSVREILTVQWIRPVLRRNV